jgi:hypothetical protein
MSQMGQRKIIAIANKWGQVNTKSKKTGLKFNQAEEKVKVSLT